jgi:hypothetical protein
MKRYRILAEDYDARANILTLDIKEGWEPQMKEMWRQNQNNIKNQLIAQFGAHAANLKLDRFIELGASPISIIAFHNNFLRQIRYAYVIGSYYPALTGACALGERILNQLIIHLRDDFRQSAEYKLVYNKDSFDDWEKTIGILESWQVLLPNVVSTFRELKKLRNEAIHFNPETDTNDKTLALESIRKLTAIVDGQFSGFGPQPWFIPDIPGCSFIKREYETFPFVRRIVVPNCSLVGPRHTLEHKNGWIVKDDFEYEAREISDSEFASLLKEQHK